jgi:flagellar biosynthetic protein FliR
MDALFDALAPGRWPALALVSARMGGLMLVAPLWSMSTLPRMLRAALTVALAVSLLPHTPPVPDPERVVDIPLPLAMEFVVGVAVGLTAAVLVQGAAMAGEVVALQMSLSLGPALLPLPEAQVSGVGQLKTFLALLIYVGTGGHLTLITGLAGSLRALPPGAPWSGSDGAPGAAGLLSTMFTVALQTAAPVMVALLVTTVALAILGRAVPQLNTMLVSFPVSIAVGLIMVGATLEIVAVMLGSRMQDLPGTLRTLLDGFRSAGGVR